MVIAMKEIVIKIDDDLYKGIYSDAEIMIYGGMRSGKTLLVTLLRAIRNGKVLPKGHGELIDARAFLQSINSNDYDTYTDYSNTFDWISDADVLVEADKGDNDDKRD